MNPRITQWKPKNQTLRPSKKTASPATPAAPIPLTAKPVHRRRLLMVVGLMVAVPLRFFGIPWIGEGAPPVLAGPRATGPEPANK